MVTSPTKLSGFTTQIHDHIAYIEAGVYRKIIAKDGQRQAVLVCLKAGTYLSKHTSSHDGFMIVIEGQGTFTLEGEETTLEAGVFISLPANTAHAIHAIANLAFLKVVDSHNDCQEHPPSAEGSP
ncbi:hypothetical protein BST81_21380 [Leptolyngbya sp. 'hensonii']|uniref:cupin domain-containing protein n=1 Tax=Leptolyngbya sp. 'hensonii' TaxID=1922337 RepID=UPI0009500C52|nr:cupin domain-containing protein [Leptolyngbya sp. 'hensonii']OLP16347.1 hypothetical protein BST81_21380 [Leptolyngbya sp. 'hensonii']